MEGGRDGGGAAGESSCSGEEEEEEDRRELKGILFCSLFSFCDKTMSN